MIDINKVKPGDQVRFQGDVGTVEEIDYDNDVLWIDFAPDDPVTDGRLDVDPDEPSLELVHD